VVEYHRDVERGGGDVGESLQLKVEVKFLFEGLTRACRTAGLMGGRLGTSGRNDDEGIQRTIRVELDVFLNNVHSCLINWRSIFKCRVLCNF